MTFSERLRTAIEDVWGGSIRAFHREMKERGVRGSSYGAIHSYLRGDTEPSRAFLEAAAEVLGVRFAWLKDDEGEPTSSGEAARAVAEPDVVALMGQVEAWITERFPAFEHFPLLARVGIWRAWQRLYEYHARHYAEEERTGDIATAGGTGKWIATHIGLQLDGLFRAGLVGESLPQLRHWQVEQFATGFALALTALLPDPHAGEARLLEDLPENPNQEGGTDGEA